MAKEPTAAKADFFVVGGQIVTGPRGKRKVFNVGDGYTPGSAEERDELLAKGTIVSAADFARLQGGPSVINALKAAEERAAAAEARAAELEAAAAAAPASAAPNPAPAQ